MSKHIGFTIIELLLSIAILLSLLSIGVPSLNEFLVKTRVDNEVYTLHRLLLLSRNAAINHNTKVTLCPLNEQSQCHNVWHQKLSVFTDSNSNKVFEPAKGEKIIKEKAAIKFGDKLQYGTRIGLTYENTGQLHGWGQNATFKYCPNSYIQLSRAVVVSLSGRIAKSQYNVGVNKDKTHSGKYVICK